ncbi:MAG TPA: PHB depolymerase family esterase [bacterium]|nr:PHB depolymerase family esterase [bacterium]
MRRRLGRLWLLAPLALLLGLPLLLLIAPRIAHAREADRHTLSAGGRERWYLLHVPPALDLSRPVPLVLLFHGGGGNPYQARRAYGWVEKANAEGFIVAFPAGSGRTDTLLTWNAGACCAYAMREQVDDVAFVKALVADLRRRFPIDPGRIYATGISNGGGMAHRLAAEKAGLFAGVGIVAGAVTLSPRWQPSEPVAAMVIHGTEDSHVRYTGGLGPNAHRGAFSDIVTPSPAQVTEYWSRINKCDPTPVESTGPERRILTYRRDGGGPEVVFVTVEGGGHAWPGSRGLKRGSLAPTQAFLATDFLWHFFAAHPKPR